MNQENKTLREAMEEQSPILSSIIFKSQEELDEELMDMFNGMCAVHLTHPAVRIHEIVPRSKAPKTWRDPENRIPLCEEIHRLVHEKGTRRMDPLLTAARKKALEIL